MERDSHYTKTHSHRNTHRKTPHAAPLRDRDCKEEREREGQAFLIYYLWYNFAFLHMPTACRFSKLVTMTPWSTTSAAQETAISNLQPRKPCRQDRPLYIVFFYQKDLKETYSLRHQNSSLHIKKYYYCNYRLFMAWATSTVGQKP